MSQKVRVVTWKMAPHRYLHEVITERGYFHIVTDSDCFSLGSFTLRNKVLARRLTKETRGLRKVREERDEWLNEDEWAILCFSGCDNLKLRKKVYGRELKTVKVVMSICTRSGRVDWIKREGGKNLIPMHSVLLRRNPRKRIKDPLHYIDFQHIAPYWGEKSIEYEFIVSEIFFIMFNLKVKNWIR